MAEQLILDSFRHYGIRKFVDGDKNVMIEVVDFGEACDAGPTYIPPTEDQGKVLITRPENTEIEFVYNPIVVRLTAEMAGKDIYCGDDFSYKLLRHVSHD